MQRSLCQISEEFAELFMKYIKKYMTLEKAYGSVWLKIWIAWQAAMEVSHLKLK